MMRPRRHPLTALWLGVPLWVAAILSSIVFSDCSDGGKAAVPLPPAYPRVQLYDTVYTVVPEAAPVRFLVNASATVAIPDRKEGKSRWVNISYPRYNAVMYCTFTPVTDSDRELVIANRAERMSLNTGDLPSEIITVDSHGGFHGQLLVTQSGSVTPIQFISTDGARWVVSGAVYLANPGRAAASDSIAPVIEALRVDAIHALAALEAD